MTASFKKLSAIVVLCITIASCSYEDKSRIRELQNQLTECKAQAQNDRETYYNAWKNKSQDLDACLAANNNLYKFVDEKGSYLDKTAKFFTISFWLSLLYGFALLVITSAFSFFGIGFLLRWQHTAKHKEAEKTIKTAKEARQAILETSGKLSSAQDEINALEAQKTALQKEIEELKQYQNIDELQEKAKIIENAKKEANRIFGSNINKINAQAANIHAEIDQERDELNEKRKTLTQKEFELQQKEKELEEIRQVMVNG